MKTTCNNCNKIINHLDTIKACPFCFKALTGDKALILKPVLKIKKRVTAKQRQAYQLIKDKMQSAKQSMIRHIQDCIDNEDYTLWEFLADPFVYFDSQIMGKYYNNHIMRNSIVKYFQEYIPF